MKSEINTEAMRLRVFDAAGAVLNPPHPSQSLQPDFEHGQWWITCVICSAIWSVVDVDGGRSVDGFDFEQIEDGDGYCQEMSDASALALIPALLL